MDKELIAKKQLQINAPLSKVWDAIVDPEKVKQYFFGMQVESGWKVGSPIIFSGSFDGKSYRDKGTILAIEPKKLLHYNYWSGFSGLADEPENHSLVTYELTKKESGTELTVTQQGFANEQAHQHAAQGWAMVLNGLKDLMEKR